MAKKYFFITDTPECGKGVFSKKLFLEDKVLFTFGTTVVPWAKANHRSIQLGKNKWLNPSKKDLGYYVNHSCNPNARFKEPNFIAALHKIKPREEITIDYSTLVNILKWDMDCACGHKSCRRIIRSYSQSPKSLQKKYKRFVSFVPASTKREILPKNKKLRMINSYSQSAL